jgi:hypothetical protein
VSNILKRSELSSLATLLSIRGLTRLNDQDEFDIEFGEFHTHDMRQTNSLGFTNRAVTPVNNDSLMS